MIESKKIFIFGTGSTSRAILTLINDVNSIKMEFDVVGFVDNDEKLIGMDIDGYKVFSRQDLPVGDNYYGISGVMDTLLREKIINNEILSIGYKLPILVHPSAVIRNDSVIGPGSLIFPGVVLSYNVTIGKNVWIDAHALVGHDVVIKDYTSIMPSSIISGRCEIGKKCILGAGSIIHQGIKIGNESLVGIGTMIIKGIPNKKSVIEFPRNIEKER